VTTVEELLWRRNWIGYVMSQDDADESSEAPEERPDWMTDMDLEILEVLAQGLTLSPSIIAENIDRSRVGVNRRLNTLQASGFVEKIERGKYEISEKGRVFIEE
jgi:Mn-dependent DtxR family transcriptional regulator